MLRAALFVGMLACFMTWAGADAAQPADQTEARALLDRVVKAHGGADNLAKLHAVRRTLRGKSYINGNGVPVEIVRLDQIPKRRRAEARLELNGQAIRFTHVYNGEKVWNSFNGETEDGSDDALKSERQEVHAHHLETLLPLLKDKDITLSLLGEVKVSERQAFGLKAAKKGHQDVDLYFDKESLLLLRTAYQAIAGDNGKEVLKEFLYSDYKEVSGLKRPMKFHVQQDGERTSEWETVEVSFLDQIEDREFVRP